MAKFFIDRPIFAAVISLVTTLGIAVFSGMVGVTLFGILLTPVFYYVIVRMVGRRPASDVAAASSDLKALHA